MLKIFKYKKQNIDIVEDWEANWASYSMEDALTWTGLSEITKIMLNNIKDGDIVFEGGCGLCRLLVYFRRFVKAKYIGMDLAFNALKKGKQQDETINCILGNLENTPLLEKKVDIYLSEGVIEHFEDCGEKILNEANRMLKDKGKLVISVPSGSFIAKVYFKYFFYNNFLRKLFKKDIANKGGFDYFLFNQKEFMQIIQEKGFEIEEFHYVMYEAGLYNYLPFVRKKNVKKDIHIFAHTDKCLNIFGKIVVKLKYLFPKLFPGSYVIIAKKNSF